MAGAQRIKAGRAYVELSTQNNVLQGLKRGLSQIKSYATEAASVAKIPLGISVAGLAGASLVTKQFASFDDQMRLAAAVSGATSKELSRLTDVAKTLGRTTSWTAEQVAAGMVSLGRMGFDSTEIENATNSVMNLARATGTEIGLATDIAGNALRSFGMDASSMGSVADILTTTANSSAQTLEDLGESLKYVSPIAKAAGLDLKETSTILGVLANFGIKGSQAGTSVKSLMSRIADEKISGKIKASTGVEVTDDAGNLRAVSDVLADIGNAVKELPNGEQLSLFKELFGLESMASGVNLATADFTAMKEAMAGVDGAAQRTAEAMDAGVGGSLRIAQSAVEGVALAIGENLAPVVIELSSTLSSALEPITEWVSSNQYLIQTAGKTVAIVGGLSAAFVGLGTAAASGVSVISFMITSFERGSAAVGRLTGLTRLQTEATAAAKAYEEAFAAEVAAAARVEQTKNIAEAAAIETRAAYAQLTIATTAEERTLATARLQTAITNQKLAEAEQLASLNAELLADKQLKTATATKATTAAALSLRQALVAVAGTVAAVAAVGAAFVWIGGMAEKATKATQEGIDKAKEEASARMEQFNTADQLLARLAELDKIQNKNNSQMAEAVSIINSLTAQYGQLGLSVDATTGKIQGLGEAQEEINRQKLQAELESKEALKAANEAKIDALKSEGSKLGGNATMLEGAGIGAKYAWHWATGGQSMSERMTEIGAERRTLTAENKTLDADIAGIKARLEAANKDKAERERQAQNPPKPVQKTEEELAIEAENKALASAKQGVLFARVDLANAEKGADQLSIEEAKEQLSEAENALSDVEKQNAINAADRAATAYEQAKQSGDEAQISQAAEQLEAALNTVDRFSTTEETKEETVEKPLSETERTLNALLGKNTLDAAQTGIENTQERTYLNDLKDAYAIQEAQKKVESAQASLAFENVWGNEESQIAANKEFVDASEQLNQLLEARGLAGGALETTQQQQGTFDAWEALSLGQDDWQKEETKKTNRFLDLLQKDVSTLVKNFENQDDDTI